MDFKLILNCPNFVAFLMLVGNTQGASQINLTSLIIKTLQVSNSSLGSNEHS